MRFRFEQEVPLPRAVVFAFHKNPEHLLLIHKGWSDVRMIHTDACVHDGCKTWIEFNVAGILPVVMGFEHIVYEPPSRFGEKLIHGPFRRFVHFHEFDTSPSGTIVRDLLDVELPWFYGGELGMCLVIAPILRRAFRLRGATLLRLAQSGELTRSAPTPL